MQCAMLSRRGGRPRPQRYKAGERSRRSKLEPSRCRGESTETTRGRSGSRMAPQRERHRRAHPKCMVEKSEGPTHMLSSVRGVPWRAPNGGQSEVANKCTKRAHGKSVGSGTQAHCGCRPFRARPPATGHLRTNPRPRSNVEGGIAPALDADEGVGVRYLCKGRGSKLLHNGRDARCLAARLQREFVQAFKVLQLRTAQWCDMEPQAGLRGQNDPAGTGDT